MHLNLLLFCIWKHWENLNEAYLDHLKRFELILFPTVNYYTGSGYRKFQMQ